MTREKALRQAAKLLKLADSDNANEAAAAAAQAQTILDRYELNAAMLSLDGGANDDDDEEIVDFGARGAPLDEQRQLNRWRAALGTVICQTNGCKLYRAGGDLQIVGRPSDADAVRYLFAYLAGEVERLTKRDAKGCGRTWANNYRLGVVDAIKGALKASRGKVAREARHEVEGDKLALVKVNQALAKVEQRRDSVEVWAKANMKLSAGSTSRYRVNSGARGAGRQAGKEINVGGGKRLGAAPKQLGN